MVVNVRSAPAMSDDVDAAMAPMSTSGRSAIVVIDERSLIRECLAKCLQMTDYVVLAFASVPDWLAAATNSPPVAVIILCPRTCKHSDLRTQRDLSALLRSAPDVPAVILSEAENLDEVVAALAGGARGYIPTSIKLDVAIEAIRLVGAGGTFVPASSIVSSRLISESSALQNRQHSTLFTERQTAVLEALQQGKANKQIAYELNMRESTVKVHVRNLMKKLNAKNRTEVAVLTSNLLGDAGEN